MRKLTDEEKQLRAEQRAKMRAHIHKLALWDMLLSGVVGTAFLVWLAVYIREGKLQGATASVWFWSGLIVGTAVLLYLIKKFVSSAKVARKI